MLGDLTGEILEVGAGTGLNLPHYPCGAQVTLLEPSLEMRKRLRVHSGDRPVIDGSVEALPFPDGRFDVVVSGFVLCSVQDVSRSLAEVHRVLRPGGRLVFLEHIASHTPWVHALQRTVQPAWTVLTRGCQLTRDTEAAILEAGFELECVDRTPLTGGFFVVGEAIRGVATRGVGGPRP